MQVMLIGKNEVHKIVLPQIAIGNYWITDDKGENGKKLINIIGDGENWQINSDNSTEIINPENIEFVDNRIRLVQNKKTILEQIVLKEYCIYGVTVGQAKDFYLLCSMPVYEKNIMRLEIKHASEITIGTSEKNSIVFTNKFVANRHARITFNNGRWLIENLDKKFGTFVNDLPVSERATVLANGDVIFIMGLKIILIGNIMYINNPRYAIKYDEYMFKENDTTWEINDELPIEEDNVELYDENDYYSRAPRITKKIETDKIKIDAPPQVQSKDEMPAALVLGSSLSMGAMMMISTIQSIDGLANGQGTKKETIFSLIIAFTMLVSMLLFPILQLKFERRRKEKYEEKRQKRYKKYIDSKIKEIDEIMAKQRKILYSNYSSVEECSRIILYKEKRLWERKIEDSDFLAVRLGIGDVPLDIDIQYPEKQFTMEDDNLVDILNTVANKSKVLKKAPIALSLVEKNISAVIGQNEEKIKNYIQNLILQLITFQSYSDLKLVFLMKEDKERKWDYIKMLPHIWSNTKDIRFFTDNYEEMKEISKYLEEEIIERKNDKEKDYKEFSPYYLIITDDYKTIENLKIINEVLNNKVNLGFSILCIANNLMKLPNECKTFINIEEGTGTIYESEISSTNQKETEFIFDETQTIFFDKICRTIANIPIKFSSKNGLTLPSSYTFLEMYDAGTIEQLNILERWRKNDSTLSLRAPIGIDGSGMKIALDIHEKFHGPHGLIAGSTGSGKSEFIITYILSLAVNYHPDDLAFILIDYKGGGLAGAFQKGNSKLPHLVGTITNIETNGLQRSLDSIQSELRRRQIMFNEARNMTDEGTIDIYKYQKLYHEGVVKEPIPHLLIICDEFAELKQQQEDFMDELISVARIGRSLGVHLILATQKPAGIVNDQIRSNSKFGVCLKVQDDEDSMDVIKRPDAAKLKNAGQFYLQVGNDEYFVLGQSAWSGAPYYPSNTTKNKVDNSIEFISNIGTVIKKVDDSAKRVVNNQGEQLTNIVKYLYELANQQKIQERQLWLEDIPENIYVDDLKKKYNIKHKENIIEPIVGEYDNPSNQSQGAVQLNFSKDGNVIIYGSSDSGKETLLSTLCYNIITSYSNDEAQMYILDFGSEALKIYKDSPHVGDVVFINESEKIDRFFEMIQEEIKIRKNIISDYNGDYQMYLKNGKDKMPMLIVIINNYESLTEMYDEKYEDIILSITREGLKYGIVFVFAVSTYSDVRYRLAQNFKQKITLQLNNEDDYSNVIENVGKKRPSHIFGRGLIPIEKNVYEFQTAKICKPEEYDVKIKNEINKLNEKYLIKAKHIPIMPKVVELKDVINNSNNIQQVPLGIEKDSLKVFNYDFMKNFITIIASKNNEDAFKYTLELTETIKTLKDAKVIIIDTEGFAQTRSNIAVNNFKKFLKELYKEMENNKTTVCVFIGIDRFISRLDEQENDFMKILEETENDGRIKYIIAENASKLKNHEYDDWYKNYLSDDSGIWVGNGIDDQYLITINSSNKKLINNCGPSYGYVIKQGEFYLIKLIGIREEKDESF